MHQFACGCALHANQVCLTLSADVIAGPHLGKNQTEDSAQVQRSST